MKYYAKVGGYYLELSTAQGEHLAQWKKGYGMRDKVSGAIIPDRLLEDKYERREEHSGVYFDNLEEEFTND